MNRNLWDRAISATLGHVCPITIGTNLVKPPQYPAEPVNWMLLNKMNDIGLEPDDNEEVSATRDT